MSVLFISHSSSDQEPSARVKAWLQAKGHASVFLDFDPMVGIPAGADWEQALYRKLRACQGVVVVCSRHSMTSRWVFAEVVRALSDGKPVFPIRVDDTPLDTILERCQVLDARHGWDGILEGLDRGLCEAGIEPTGPRTWNGGCPYPGLTAFGVEEAPVFFGREEETHRGLDLLRRLRRAGGGLGLVLGDSGSGKSSLLRAGLVPRLQEDGGRWILVGPFRPGRDPFAELAGALSLAGGGDWKELQRRMTTPGTQPGRVLADVIRELRLERKQPEATVLLLVDQFEELLDLPADHPGRRLVEALAGAVDGASGLVALGTLRSDYLSVFLQDGSLQALCPGAGLLPDNLALGALPQERLAEVIKKPAELARLGLEDSLVQALLEDTGTADALPLLAFTLRELFERYGGKGILGLQDYRSGLGGLQESVGRAAETVLEAHRRRLGGGAFAREEAALRRALLSLVRINDEGAFARRSATWDELPEAAHPLLKELVEARLLIAREGGSVEVAHEALLRTWHRLRDWLEDEREALRLRRRLEQQTEEWSKYDRAAGYLVREPELSRMVQLLADYALQPMEREFLGRSLEARDRDRARVGRLRKGLVLLTVSVLLVVLGVTAASNQRLRRSLAEATGFRLAAQSKELAQSKPELALLLAAAGVEVATGGGRALPTTESGLREILGQTPSEPLYRATGSLWGVAMTPDGKILAVASDKNRSGPPEGGEIRVWRLGQRGEPRVLSIGKEQVLSVALSRDGRTLASGWGDGTVRLWNLDDRGSLPRILQSGTRIVDSVGLGGDGRALASSSWEGSIRVWDLQKGGAPRVLRHPNGAGHIVLSQDGRRLATLSGDGIRVWDLWKGAEPDLIKDSDWAVQAIALSGDGKTLASGSASGLLRVWDLEKAAPPQMLGDSDSGVISIALSASGRSLVAGMADGTVRIWDLRGWGKPLVLRGHESPVSQVAIALENRMVLSGSSDGAVRLCFPGGGEPAEVCRHGGPVLSVCYSPDGRTLASASADGDVIVNDLAALGKSQVLHGHSDQVFSVAMAQGNALASASSDGTVRLWNLETGRAAHVLRVPYVESMALARDGQSLAAASRGEKDVVGPRSGSVILWKLEDRAKPRVLARFEGGAGGLAFSPNGSKLAAEGWNSLRLWDLSNGNRLREFSGGGGPSSSSLAWTPDGGTLVSNGIPFGPGQSEEPVIHLWDPSRGKALRIIRPGEPVRHLAVSPDGRTLAGSWPDLTSAGAVVLWDLEGREEPRFLRGHGDTIEAVAFAPDGRTLATGSCDGSVLLWDLSPLSLIRKARTAAGRDFTPKEIEDYDLETWGELLPPGAVGSQAVAEALAKRGASKSTPTVLTSPDSR